MAVRSTVPSVQSTRPLLGGRHISERRHLPLARPRYATWAEGAGPAHRTAGPVPYPEALRTLGRHPGDPGSRAHDEYAKRQRGPSARRFAASTAAPSAQVFIAVSACVRAALSVPGSATA